MALAALFWRYTWHQRVGGQGDGRLLAGVQVDLWVLEGNLRGLSFYCQQGFVRSGETVALLGHSVQDIRLRRPL